MNAISPDLSHVYPAVEPQSVKATRAVNSSASMRSVLLLVGAAILIFMASTAYSVHFLRTLADSQHDAAVILYMGLALGGMNLGFMAILVFFIRKNVTMMALIAEQNATLELRVAERTAALSQKTNDINAMLQNMKPHLRDLELSSAAQKEELDIISKIIRISVNKFCEFSESATAFIADNRRAIGASKVRDSDIIADLFRNMHTIKCNARSFEFTHITDAAHSAEATYDELRKNADAPWNREVLLAELDAVDAAVTQYIRINEDKLGRKGRASDLLTTRGVFVGNNELTQLRSLVSTLDAGDAKIAKLQNQIKRLGFIPLDRLVSGSVDSLSSLANELRKPAPAAEVVNGGFAFNSRFAEALKCSLMHILRNSLEHGIEAPQERLQRNKAERGTVKFSCRQDGDRVSLTIGDDGRGLALHKLHEKAAAAGLFAAGTHPTKDDIAEVIFHSGLSTSAGVTQVSGRGVGMDAVRTFLQEQGASIRIVLQESAGTKLDFTPFTFVIDVPLSAYAH